MSIEMRYKKWLDSADGNTVLKLRELTDAEKKDSFYKDIEFGTGGMRGLLGVGTNRVNKYTIARATKGFADYINENGKTAASRGVAIAHDNRRQSRELALVTAGVLAYEGIKVYLFEDLRTTPELSFAVRHIGCFGGVVITASHNPPEYNGYKLYDETGCQLVPAAVEKVIPHINAVENELEVKSLSLDEAGSLIEIIGSEVDEAYYEKVLGIRFNTDREHSITAVYTPQHGTGNIPVREVLSRAGYNVIPVESQCFPDTEFKNTKNPNPEMPEAYERAIEILKEKNADIAIATDPDCDRLGAVINCGGEYRLMTGNQSGAVILYYLLCRMKEQGAIPENGLMVNTVVTSTLGDKIAEDFGLSVEKTLTGFKFIGEKIKLHEMAGDKKFVFGYEESYGCLIGDFVRDKDAVQASLMFCEAADFYKKQGKTLIDVLDEIYGKYGYFLDTLTSLTLKGEDGAKKISAILDNLRQNPVSEAGGVAVKKITDYNNPPEGFVKSNVLHYEFTDGSFVAVRPSGTEPKCKFYYCVCDKDSNSAKKRLEQLKAVFEKTE